MIIFTLFVDRINQYILYGTSWPWKFVFIRSFHVLSCRRCACLLLLSVQLPIFQIAVTQTHSKSFYIETPTLFPQIHWMTFIGRVFIVLWHNMTKYIFRRLNKQWYQCPIDLIAYNITTILSIIEWNLIRYHQPNYIDRKYISYLPLSIEVFSRNLFLTKFKHLLLLIHFLSQHIRWSKKIFLSTIQQVYHHHPVCSRGYIPISMVFYTPPCYTSL